MKIHEIFFAAKSNRRNHPRARAHTFLSSESREVTSVLRCVIYSFFTAVARECQASLLFWRRYCRGVRFCFSARVKLPLERTVNFDRKASVFHRGSRKNIRKYHASIYCEFFSSRNANVFTRFRKNIQPTLPTLFSQNQCRED